MLVSVVPISSGSCLVGFCIFLFVRLTVILLLFFLYIFSKVVCLEEHCAEGDQSEVERGLSLT